MGSSKFLEVCLKRSLIPSMKKPPPPEALGTGKFVLEAIARSDLFDECDAEMLRPDDPPVVDRTCLPGTTRRPLKPWQLCTSAEKVIVLSFMTLQKSRVKFSFCWPIADSGVVPCV